MVASTGYIQEGEILNFVNGTGSAIGYLDIITIAGQNDKILIAAESIGVAGTGGVYTEGTFELPAKTEAFAFGDTVYYDTTNGYVTKTALGNISAGVVTEAKLQAGTSARVKLVPGLNNTRRIYSKMVIPIAALASLTNAAKIMDGLTAGFAGRIESLDFITGTTPASTASKDASLLLKIGTTAVTGGVVSLTTATVNAVGKVVAGTAITAANVFTATDTISLVAGNPSAVFAEGNGEAVMTYSQVIQ